ncbi:MAG: rhodanese-like domain-containing protein [Arenicellales bacterium]
MLHDFVVQNWYLFVALVVVLGLLVADPLMQQASGVKSVSVLEMPRLTREKYVILDVSDAAEYKKTHIPEAINLPAKSLSQDQKSLEKHKKKNVIVVCRTGNKAHAAAKQLIRSGFEKVFVLSGGMAAWQKENLPVKSG